MLDFESYLQEQMKSTGLLLLVCLLATGHCFRYICL